MNTTSKRDTDKLERCAAKSTIRTGLRRKLLTKVKLNCPGATNINSDTLSSQSAGNPVRIDWADVAYAIEYSGGYDADD